MQPDDHKQDWKRLTSTAVRIIWALEIGGLAVIAIATLIAGYLEILHMVDKQAIDLSGLLLLFLYLEILAMVGIYLESRSLPVRLPMYIGIVALARYLIIDAKKQGQHPSGCCRSGHSYHLTRRAGVELYPIPLPAAQPRIAL